MGNCSEFSDSGFVMPLQTQTTVNNENYIYIYTYIYKQLYTLLETPMTSSFVRASATGHFVHEQIKHAARETDYGGY